MFIAWLTDFTVKNFAGGAQFTNEANIKAGTGKGHHIEVITPSLDNESVLDKPLDLYILTNITRFNDSFISKIINEKNYIVRSHDLYLYENSSRFPGIFNKSITNIFMSRSHMLKYQEKLDIPAAYVTSPVDVKLFKKPAKKNLKDEKLVVWVGNDSIQKGISNIIGFAKINPDLKFKLFGNIRRFDKVDDEMVERDFPSNVEVVGEVSQEELIKWYQKAKYVIALPDDLEADGRSILEGFLCGCDLILNDNVGFIYENWNWSNYSQIKKNAKTEEILWNIIEESYRNKTGIKPT